MTLLEPGDAIPEAHFIDQDSKPRDTTSYQGSTLLLALLYTRCPLPAFCSLKDPHFATIQTALKADQTLRNVHLVSVSFDPATDTPSVLKEHARGMNANSARWTFLTGDCEDIYQFANHFGVSIAPAQNDGFDITHTLRTTIVDSTGTLAYVGNEWTPA